MILYNKHLDSSIKSENDKRDCHGTLSLAMTSDEQNGEIIEFLEINNPDFKPVEFDRFIDESYSETVTKCNALKI